MYFSTSKASKLSTFELLSHGHAEPRVEVSVVFFVFERSVPDGMLRAILLFSLLALLVPKVLSLRHCVEALFVFFVFERS